MGDLVSLTEDKLVLLYISNNVNLPLTSAQIYDFADKNAVINYFSLLQYLNELVEGEHLITYEQNGETLYKITKKGKQTLDYFQSRIPLSMREKIESDIERKYGTIKQSLEIFGEYYPSGEHDYFVECRIMEKGSCIMELKLGVGSKAQAKKMCNFWKENHETLYYKIITALSPENENTAKNYQTGTAMSADLRKKKRRKH